MLRTLFLSLLIALSGSVVISQTEPEPLPPEPGEITIQFTTSYLTILVEPEEGESMDLSDFQFEYFDNGNVNNELTAAPLREYSGLALSIRNISESTCLLIYPNDEDEPERTQNCNRLDELISIPTADNYLLEFFRDPNANNEFLITNSVLEGEPGRFEAVCFENNDGCAIEGYTRAPILLPRLPDPHGDDDETPSPSIIALVTRAQYRDFIEEVWDDDETWEFLEELDTQQAENVLRNVARVDAEDLLPNFDRLSDSQLDAPMYDEPLYGEAYCRWFALAIGEEDIVGRLPTADEAQEGRTRFTSADIVNEWVQVEGDDAIEYQVLDESGELEEPEGFALAAFRCVSEPVD